MMPPSSGLSARFSTNSGLHQRCAASGARLWNWKREHALVVAIKRCDDHWNSQRPRKEYYTRLENPPSRRRKSERNQCENESALLHITVPQTEHQQVRVLTTRACQSRRKARSEQAQDLVLLVLGHVVHVDAPVEGHRAVDPRVRGAPACRVYSLRQSQQE